jgi:hypothetical protein
MKKLWLSVARSMVLVTGCIVALIALIGLLFFAWDRIQYAMLPPMAKGLPSNVEKADAEFNRRVQNRFAIGSSEVKLFSELNRQGFRPNNEKGDGIVEKGHIVRVYSAHMSQFPCDLIWNVVWQADDDRLMELRGVYYGSCL